MFQNGSAPTTQIGYVNRNNQRCEGHRGLAGIRCKVLVLHGGDDPHVPPKDVDAFEDEMRAAGVDWQLVVYGGAVHAFTNPASGNDKSKGAACNAEADRRSWEATKGFFVEVLK